MLWKEALLNKHQRHAPDSLEESGLAGNDKRRHHVHAAIGQ
jgi:hypothetical protein